MQNFTVGKTKDTWAEQFYDDVPAWLRTYASLYRAAGHTSDDAAQEGRVVLLKQEETLDAFAAAFGAGTSIDSRVKAYARKMVQRAVKEQLIGRRKCNCPPASGPPESWDTIEEATSREHSAHVQIELAEAIDAADADVRPYLRMLICGAEEDQPTLLADPFYADVRRKAGTHLLRWFAVQYYWRGAL